MEEIEISSWLVLDAIKKIAKIEETVGNLQVGHWMSVFCTVEDDFLELAYSDTALNYIKRFEDREEFDMALEKRREEIGEAPYDEEPRFDETYEEEEIEKTDDFNEEPEL